MKREDLNKIEGLSKEQVDSIMDLHQEDVTAWNAKITAAQTEAKNKQTQIDTLTEEVKKFDGVDVDQLNKTIADLQNNEKNMKRDFAITTALGKTKAKSEKMLRSILDLDAVTMQEDGSLLGLNEQLEKAKKDNPFLFESDEPAGPQNVNLGGEHGDNTNNESAMLDKIFGVNQK